MDNLKQDAKRYRWLRDYKWRPSDGYNEYGIFVKTDMDKGFYSYNQLIGDKADIEIDKAMENCNG